MQETTRMKDSKFNYGYIVYKRRKKEGAASVLIPGTPLKPHQTINVYENPKSPVKHEPQEIEASELLISEISSGVPINTSGKDELLDKCFFPGDCGFVIIKDSAESEIPQDGETKTEDDAQGVDGKGGRKNSKVKPKKQVKKRRYWPRIKVDQKKPKKKTATVSRKRKRETTSEGEAIVEPGTPEKQSLPRRKRNDKAKGAKVARDFSFDHQGEYTPSCLEVSRNCGLLFPEFCKRNRTARCPRLLAFPIWKNRSRRSIRRKNVTRWAKMALCNLWPERAVLLVPSLAADVPLQPEDVPSVSIVVPKPRRNTRTKDIVGPLIPLMRRLNINVTRPGRKRKILTSELQLVSAQGFNMPGPKKSAKVDLDPDTLNEWMLIMTNPGRSDADNETESKWKVEREVFKSRVDLLIKRMHLLQADRKFKLWKGSVVDSAVGVFLTQNVSDHLSSNAYISMAATFPVNTTEDHEDCNKNREEPPENNFIDINVEDQSKVALDVEEDGEKTAKRKNKKTGVMEDETVDWKSLRKMYTKEGPRDKGQMDSVDWNALRLSKQDHVAASIKERGQHNIIAGRIMDFLNKEVEKNGTVDLEWLRDAPSDLVKRYLLEIDGLGLKSVECIRLLGLQHAAFPVDTNVGRIAVRLGWVPLEPLPGDVHMHLLDQYPLMDSIQKYLWPRLCRLSQETLYELHYQMITFGKVFCTKLNPNCNACPMKSECKYFASAYASSKLLLQGPKEKTQENSPADANMESSITLIQECVSPARNNQIDSCEPIVEFPSSPSAEDPEFLDIEDAFSWSSYQPSFEIPEIDVNVEALKENVEAILKTRKLLSNTPDDEISKALVALTPENICIPVLPKRLKYYNRLRTEHVVYVLPDDHELLREFEKRESDDPSPYLLTVWQPGEEFFSCTPPQKKCDSDGSKLCERKRCSYCCTIREQDANILRGTILIPCRTAMRGSFPLNGTYFQINEVFADQETSLKPVVFPREWSDGLEKRALYCGSSVSAIFRNLDTRRIQLCFWTGFICVRGFDRQKRFAKELVRRLHTPPAKSGKKYMRDDED